MSTPDIPAPGPPPQEAKQPDAANARKRKPAVGGGTILTSPSGVALASQNTGGTSLLGG